MALPRLALLALCFARIDPPNYGAISYVAVTKDRGFQYQRLGI